MSDWLGLSAARNLHTPDDRNLNRVASGLLIAALVITFLYFGRVVFEPLAIATLLSLILAPIIRRLRRWGFGKAPSVLVTVLVTFAALGVLGFSMSMQIAELADDLPKYESNLVAKARALRGASLSSGALDRAAGTLKQLEKEIDKPDQVSGPTLESTSPGKEPLLVEVRQRAPTTFESYRALVEPLMSPLASTGLIVLFLIFILLQREDIRDRVLRLAGTRDLQRSTEAMNDAGGRLSGFFLMQTALNISFGVLIGTGLWIIGVPSPVLWGILAGLMRFVPFIGSFIAAAIPIALAAAVDPGWTMVLWTAALFLILEPLAGQVVEPMIYGHGTGLSPVAVVVSSLFWAVIWGPVGLLLAMPLTLCLVVLGKHVEGLSFINIALGDEPALAPEQGFYQRLLAGDATEVAEQAEQLLKTHALSAYYDSVPMKALALAQADAADRKLSHEKQLEIRDTIEEVVDDLADYSDETPAGAEETEAAGISGTAEPIVPVTSKDDLAPEGRGPFPVLCIASRSPLDECASAMLAHVLGKHGIEARVQPFADVGNARGFKIDVPDARIVCLSYFGVSGNPAHVRYLIRRLKRVMPQAKFLAGFWLLESDTSKVEGWAATVGADLVATSLVEATALCVNEAMQAAKPLGHIRLATPRCAS